jgi:hypothetical protein
MKTTQFFPALAAVLMTLIFAPKADALDWQFEDTGSPVWVEADPIEPAKPVDPPVCSTDAECPYGQQCNTGTGACFTPISATACACAPDGDLCTDDAGVPSAAGGCFCTYNRLTTPECSKPIFPIVEEPWPDPVPLTPDPPTPVDPPADTPPLPTPPTPPAADVPGDACADLPAELRDCCDKVGGSPVDVMEFCVRKENRASDCDIVVNVLGSVGDKAQMNVCCNVLNNSGSIADSEIAQECRNTYEEGSSVGAVAPAGGGSSTPISETTTKSEAASAETSGGCSLIR